MSYLKAKKILTIFYIIKIFLNFKSYLLQINYNKKFNIYSIKLYLKRYII